MDVGEFPAITRAFVTTAFVSRSRGGRSNCVVNPLVCCVCDPNDFAIWRRIARNVMYHDGHDDGLRTTPFWQTRALHSHFAARSFPGLLTPLRMWAHCLANSSTHSNPKP
eukprot:GHVU01140137.1.p2 GENE.GHVU01140137.1~~GHVU01140137.1.p2  ORF type:complete len:110 (+),score=1.84 GHVU01140137.1:502-831(+)